MISTFWSYSAVFALLLPQKEEPVVIEPKKKTSFWKIIGRTLLVAVITAVVALAAYLLIARFMPEVLDNVLYSPEELEIINKSIC